MKTNYETRGHVWIGQAGRIKRFKTNDPTARVSPDRKNTILFKIPRRNKYNAVRIKKKVKKVTKSQLKRKADALFSLKIRKRGLCQRCMAIKDLQCAHIITRANLRLRYDEKNVLCLCKGCHFYMHHHGLEFFDWYNAVYKDEAEYIREAKNEIRKMRIEDYESLIKKLQFQTGKDLVIEYTIR